MTKIVMTSDLHGNLPEIPECDLLLLAGDYAPYTGEKAWSETHFKQWLNEVPAAQIVGVAGNHDFFLEDPESDPNSNFNWHYLLDSSVDLFGLRIYGMPWQRRFYDWAFNLDEEDLAAKADAIENCDIYLGHGPPHGIGDFVPKDQQRAGCPELTKKLKEINPQLAVFGHIHEGAGVYQTEDCETTFCNVSYVDSKYRPKNKPLVIEL